MQLALDFGCTLEELNGRMTSKEFALWAALHRLQPRGVERDNFHAALQATILANIHAPKGKRFKVADFMHENADEKSAREFDAFAARLRSLSKEKGKE